MAYDERHGYRGPLARVALAGAVEPADASAPVEPNEPRLCAPSDDHHTVLDYESAIVLAADELGARVSSRPTASSRWFRRRRVGEPFRSET